MYSSIYVMAEGYGIKVSDWLLVGVIAAGAYILYKIYKAPSDLVTSAGDSVSRTITNTKETFITTTENVGKTIFVNDGSVKGFVDDLPPNDYQKVTIGTTPAGNETKHLAGVNASVQNSGYYSSGRLNQKVQPVSYTPAGSTTKHGSAVSSAISSQNYYVGTNLINKQPELKRLTASSSLWTKLTATLAGANTKKVIRVT